MAVTDDILATYRSPKAVYARLLAQPVREDRALSYLIAALIVIFVAQWPGLSRAAHFQPEVPMTQRMVAAFLASLAAVPVMYLLAAAGHHVARALGGQGAYFGARIALFWALLAASPLMLLQGLITGFIGQGPGLTVTRVVVFAVFMWFWATGLRRSHVGVTP